jgi:hypothetical protein
VILEGLCTTRNSDGTINLAPMGAVVDEDLTRFVFRPFQTSQTFANLKSRRCGVFHVTDDVGLIARSAVGRISELPEMLPATRVDGMVLAGSCRWYEFEVTSIDETQERAEISTRLAWTGHLRDFFGLNRAKHAVLEAAILATRLHLISPAEIQRQFEPLALIVEKTGGDQELSALEFLRSYIAEDQSHTKD